MRAGAPADRGRDGLIVRPVTPADRAVWEELFDGYAAFYKTSVGPEAKAAVWAWIFGDEEFWCDLAEVDGKVVGMVQYQLMHRSLSGAKVCYLSDLYVRPMCGALGSGGG